MTENAGIIEFPTTFPVKALGRTDARLRPAVLKLVAEHANFDPERDVREHPSRNGNFVSITITFTAHSQTQLDAIYQSLHDHELVLMVF